MPRYAFLVEYDGTGLCGWQKQDGRISAQGLLEQAFFSFCGEHAEVVGAGRTDAGVHARGQIAHVDLTKEQAPFTIMQALNYYLRPHDEEEPPVKRMVSVAEVSQVPDDFHARFSAKGRHYIYTILNRRAPSALDGPYSWHVPQELDITAMQKAASMLIGNHDFTSFRDSECQAKSAQKTLDVLDVRKEGEFIRLYVSARSFLHHQVRIMAGTLMQIGLHKREADSIPDILAARDRRAAGQTAPPQGLCLMRVEY